MKYLEYKNLCQGSDLRLGQGRSDKKLDNNPWINGMTWVTGLIILLIAIIVSLCSCHRSHYSQRFKAHETDPPIYLIAEIPSLKIMKPEGRKVAKEPKERKGKYVMPQYKRETNIYKWMITK